MTTADKVREAMQRLHVQAHEYAELHDYALALGDPPQPVPESLARSLGLLSPNGSAPVGSAPDLLPFFTVGQLIDRVRARGARQWLVVGVWPAGLHGVHAAESKAQKTWNACDLAVSVATGTPWLDSLPVQQTGPVVMFSGEGGEESIARRLLAIGAARGVDIEPLPIHVCTRAPRLGDAAHLALMRDKLAQVQPVLVILDPLYLSAGGASMADLYSMGPLLEAAQHLCSPHRAALFVVTHYNRKDGRGASRFLGAGPAEWGRVLIGATVVSKHLDLATKATTVVTDLDILGGDIPDQTYRLQRYIRADDPDDLDSPLAYQVRLLDADAGADDLGLAPAAAKLLAAVLAQDAPATSVQLVDWIADHHGHGLKRETVSRALNDLARRGLVDSLVPAPGAVKLWLSPTLGVA